MNDSTITVRPAVEVFWGELAAGDHCVQFYESDAAFMDALEAFAVGGIRRSEAIIVIGTESHRRDLETRLEKSGFDLELAKASDQFISLDAGETLRRFMIDGWPDDALFQQMISELLGRARKDNRKVRAFGEMVALMWADGHCDATVRLEEMWSRLCQHEAFSLFCAYPKTGFAENITAAMKHICLSHSKFYIL
jgi:hypothetical protein